MTRALFVFAIFSLTGCATADLPDGFVYETSLRGQQGWHGGKARNSAAADLLSKGVLTTPQTALKTALPNRKIDLRKWGVSYFDQDWTRYRILLEADIQQDKRTVKCRLSEPETVKDAPLLRELEADGGRLVQDSLNKLVAACADKVLNPASP